jgi:serine/threonine-protein kinase
MLTSEDIEKLGDLVINGHLTLSAARRLLDAAEERAEERPAGEPSLVDTFEQHLEEFQKDQTIAEPIGQTIQLGETSDPLGDAATIHPGELNPIHAPDSEAADSADEPTSMEVGVGHQLPGSRRYSLEEKLGEGGAGTVWLARDHFLERNVALKVLSGDLNEADEQAKRFLFEAQTTGRLDHPGVIPVYDVGTLPDDRWFYTMQLIDERDFEEVLQQRETDSEVAEDYPLPRLLKIFSRVCLIIAYAHDSGVLHRDLKPANIMLGAYGEVYVVDWGLARYFTDEADAQQTDEGPDAPEDAEEGEVVGTPYYMAPEQIRGENAGMGPKTDVYALGVILYRLLTGQVPFDAPTIMSLLLKVETEDPPDPYEVAPDREIPEPLAEAALEAMSHEAGDRMSAQQLADRVTEYLDGVKEKRRRAERADELLDRARALHQAYVQARKSVEGRRRALEERMASLNPEDGLEARKPLWEKEGRIDEAAHEAEELYSKSVQAARESLESFPTSGASRLLADLYWYKYAEACEDRDEAKELYFRSLVEEYDDGRYADRLADTGELALRVPSDRETHLYRSRPVGPLLELEEVEGDWSGQPFEVPTGSYRVTVDYGEAMVVETPVEVDSHQCSLVEVSAPSPPVDGEFCFIPGGRYTVGGDSLAPKSLPEQTVELEPFLMRQYPVTLEEYCEFLNDIAQEDFELAKSHSPRTPDGSVYYLDIDPEARHFGVPAVDKDGHAWDPQWPVTMVNLYDARAYTKWRSRRDGVDYRLPSEHQWEVAARGVDRRIFPWGNGFDPTLCHMAESTAGRPMPCPVGSYPYDRSPFGVCDMAGLVIEWTRTRSESGGLQFIQRGGSYGSPSNWCRAAARKNNEADMNFASFGFRFALDFGS